VRLSVDQRSESEVSMSSYYPYGVFCNKYGCWCDDVIDITENQNDCNGNCSECKESEEI